MRRLPAAPTPCRVRRSATLACSSTARRRRSPTTEERYDALRDSGGRHGGLERPHDDAHRQPLRPRPEPAPLPGRRQRRPALAERRDRGLHPRGAAAATARDRRRAVPGRPAGRAGRGRDADTGARYAAAVAGRAAPAAAAGVLAADLRAGPPVRSFAMALAPHTLDDLRAVSARV